jgi:putative transposase
MPNHVHLIAVPETDDGLRRGIGEAHKRYSRFINIRENWTGHLWQGRFGSFIMDDTHLYAAARYIETNPSRAGLVSRATDWPWSSAKAHITGTDDSLVKAQPLLKRISVPWETYLQEHVAEATIEKLRHHERTGRPLGSESFMDRLEKMLARPLKLQKRGPKKRKSTCILSQVA